MTTSLRLGATVALMFGVLHGCSDDSKSDDSSPTTTTTVGVSGGTVRAGGVTLDIPAGALAASVGITVQETSAVTTPAGLVKVGPAYDLGPDGTTFTKPVVVTIDLSSVTRAGSPTLYHSSDGQSWGDAEGSSFDGATKTLTGFIQHFSYVAAFELDVAGSAGTTGTGTGGTSPASGGSTASNSAGGSTSSSTGGSTSSTGGSGASSAGAGGTSTSDGGAAGAAGAGGSADPCGCCCGLICLNFECVEPPAGG